MKFLAAFFFISVYNFQVMAQTILVKKKINQTISMKISEALQLMPPQQLIDRYASSRIPIAMFTSQDAKIDFGINETATNWGSDDIEILLSFYKASISNLYSQVDFVQSQISTVDHRSFIVFEFIGTISEESLLGGVNLFQKYNYIQYIPYGGKVLLFNFNCDPKERDIWAPIAAQMMRSVKLK